MLKLKLQYFGHLMQRANSFEKTLMLGKIEGGRRRGRQRMRWLDGITDSRTWVWVNSRSWWWTGKPGVLQSMWSQSRTQLRDWTEPIIYISNAPPKYSGINLSFPPSLPLSLSLYIYMCVCVCVCVCAQWYPHLCDPISCSPPGSSAHGIFQARILECIAISYSRGSSWLRDQTQDSGISCKDRKILYHCTIWEAHIHKQRYRYVVYMKKTTKPWWKKSKN